MPYICPVTGNLDVLTPCPCCIPLSMNCPNPKPPPPPAIARGAKCFERLR